MAVNKQNKETEDKVITKLANSYLIPLAIIVGFGFVAGAIFINGNVASTSATIDNQPAAEQEEILAGTTDDVREVTAEDHIKGNIDAPVVIVEYSDFECPFCKRFHDTMNQVLDEDKDSGEVAWVFRHFPIPQLHPRNATVVALASECAAEQGGNDMFWRFADRFMELTPSNDRTDLSTVLPKIYSEVGLNQTEMDLCIQSGKYINHIEDDRNNAITTGGRGTPWSVVIAPNGKTFPLNGAQPLGAVNKLIKLAAQEQ